MRSVAAVFALVLPVALPDSAAVFIRGIPDLGAESLTAVTADDAGREDAVTAVLPSPGLAPDHFELHDLPFVRRDDRLMRLFHIVLRSFALMRLTAPSQKICGDPLLETVGYFDTI